MKNFILATLTCAALAAFIHPATAAPGDLDLTFGGTGTVVTAIGSGDDTGNSVATQSDGKIVVAGYSFNGSNYDFALVRYNADGSLDTTFNPIGHNGKVTTAIGSGDDGAYSVAVQGNGKIVATGYSSNAGKSNIAVVRYNADGSPDPSFGSGGIVTTSIGGGEQASGVAVQSDGKIMVAGHTYNGNQSHYDIALVRYTETGALDPSFGGGTGIVTTAFASDNSRATSLAMQNDGKILVAGYTGTNFFSFVVARYNPDGLLDTTFNPLGAKPGTATATIGSTYNICTSLAIQGDGKVLLAGYSDSGLPADITVVRFTSAGILDSGFNGTGKVRTHFDGGGSSAASVAVQLDGKVVVGGHFFAGGNSDVALVRYTEAGVPDPSFGANGKVTTVVGSGVAEAVSLAVQRDGKIFVAGYSLSGGNYDFAVVAYLGEPATYNAMIPAVEFLFGTVGGSTYSIEASFDFTNWTTIETNIAGTGGLISRLYSIRGQPKRFFRSRQN
jgi:uncharacterized delta-60 repeat protein